MVNWSRLAEFLEGRPASLRSIRLSYEDIEGILGDRLPKSAYEYRPFWANERAGSRASSWLATGWTVVGDPRAERVVTLVRALAPSALRRPTVALKDEGSLSKQESPSGLTRRRIGGLEFKKVCDIRPHGPEQGFIATHTPQSRYANTKALSLHSYGSGSFCRFRIPKAWRRHAGVYVIAQGDQILYVGETHDLVQRFNSGYGQISPRNCYVGGQETNCRINRRILNAVTNGSVLELWFHEEAGGRLRRRATEAEIRSGSLWPWNL